MKLKYRLIIIGLIVSIIMGLGIYSISDQDSWEVVVNRSLYSHSDFFGHPWYIAPMEGKTVELYNGSVYKVIRDYWDSCEHNPQQGHLIGIGYINKTAYAERVILDGPVATRNYTATWLLLIWANASKVARVLP